MGTIPGISSITNSAFRLGALAKLYVPIIVITNKFRSHILLHGFVIVNGDTFTDVSVPL